MQKTKSADDEALCLSRVVFLAVPKLAGTLAVLSPKLGKEKQAEFVDPSDEEKRKVVNLLLKDSKGSYRVRNILGIGLQQGLNTVNEWGLSSFWRSMLEVCDAFLFKTEFPRIIDTKKSSGNARLVEYQDCWRSLVFPDGGVLRHSEKKLKLAQETFLVDILLAFWRDRLSSDEMLEAIAFLDLDPEGGKPHWGKLATSLLSELPASVIVDQAGKINEEILKLKQSLEKISDEVRILEESLDERSQELEDTESALEDETALLRDAEKAIGQLELDVRAAGAIQRHRADELSSRYRGLLVGELDRHLKIIQRSTEMNPPRSAVIVERVETLLGTLKREIQWLENSE